MTVKQRQEEKRLFGANRSGDARAREQLVERFLPLAQSIARRYGRRGEPLDDLQQVAALALVKAIDSFDADRGTAFSSYAVPSIAGALKRYYRDAGWSVRPPRDVQDVAINVRRLEDELHTPSGAPPTAAQIAEQLGLPVEAVLEAREAYHARFCESLDKPRSSGDGEDAEPLGNTIGVSSEELAQADDRVMVETLLHTLDARERMVVRLYYHEDLTQAEIGQRLGYSQMHVSRMLRSAVNKLMIEAAPQEPPSSTTVIRLAHPEPPDLPSVAGGWS
jgi:RNA polymerase sigma-B factor